MILEKHFFSTWQNFFSTCFTDEKEKWRTRKIMMAKTFSHLFLSQKHKRENNLDQKMDHQNFCFLTGLSGLPQTCIDP